MQPEIKSILLLEISLFFFFLSFASVHSKFVCLLLLLHLIRMKLMIIIITSLFVAQCIVEVAAAAANQISQTPDMEQNLLNALFKNYNKKLKPLGTVEVKFALNLNQIVNLIEKDQIIVLNVFLDHEWTDNRLRWNPAEHNNISILRVSSDLVWT